MNDYILFGLYMWCVAGSYFAVVFYLKNLKLKLLLLGAVETIKQIGEGKATIEMHEDGISIKRNK